MIRSEALLQEVLYNDVFLLKKTSVLLDQRGNNYK